MSLFEERYEKLRIGNDDCDQFVHEALETLTPQQREILNREFEICEALDKKYGWQNVTDEMREEAIANDGAGL